MCMARAQVSGSAAACVAEGRRLRGEGQLGGALACLKDAVRLQAATA